MMYIKMQPGIKFVTLGLQLKNTKQYKKNIKWTKQWKKNQEKPQNRRRITKYFNNFLLWIF